MEMSSDYSENGEKLMRTKYIAQFEDSDSITEVFLVESKNLAVTRAGKPYMNLTLRDKTGTISAKVWDDAELINRELGASELAEISGRIETYQKKLQFRVDSIRALKPEKVDMADILPATDQDVEKMFEDVMQICSTVANRHLRKLLDTFFSDKEFVEKFKIASAAKSIHHAYIGGLLEHTLSILIICDKLAAHYTDLDRDLILGGAFFHDIGKVYELGGSTSFDYTREGSLIGHVVIGYRLVENAINKISGFPDKLREELGHMILSHQGKLEFGAPVKPTFAEAALLHYVDDLDVRMNIFKRAIASDRNTGSDFTDRLWELDSTRVYKGIQGGTKE